MKSTAFNYKVTRVVGNFGPFYGDGIDYYLLRGGGGTFQFCKIIKGYPTPAIIDGASFCVIFGHVSRNWTRVVAPIYVSE